MPRQSRASSRVTTKSAGAIKRKVTRALSEKLSPPAGDRAGAPTARMTLVLYDDQLRWLRRQAFEARDQGQRGVDMSSILRQLLDAAMARR